MGPYRVISAFPSFDVALKCNIVGLVPAVPGYVLLDIAHFALVSVDSKPVHEAASYT